MPRTSYHHGDLRVALVDAGLAMVAERGIEALSVAEAAKRAGVSVAAPYRHFPNRKAFLAAVATAAAREFDHEVRAALQAVRGGPLHAVEATAGTYVRFVARRRIGWDVIFGHELRDVVDADRLDVTRSLNDAFLEPALAVTGGDVRTALRLLEREIAAAHGYATLFISGMFERRYPDVERAAAQAAAITRTLAEAAARPA